MQRKNYRLSKRGVRRGPPVQPPGEFWVEASDKVPQLLAVTLDDPRNNSAQNSVLVDLIFDVTTKAVTVHQVSIARLWLVFSCLNELSNSENFSKS